MVRKHLTVIAVPLFGLLAGLLVVELGFRLIEGRLEKKVWSDRPTFYFAPEKSHTLQDYPYNAKKAPNTFRIAVIGDSFAFAPHMQFTDAFPKKIEQMLNLNDTSKRAEVINFGVSAASTAHEVPLVRQAIKEEADLIIMQITLNDPEIKHRMPVGVTDTSRFAPYEPQGAAAWVMRRLHIVKFIVKRIHNSQSRRDYIEYFKSLYENPKSWMSFKNAWRQISAEGRKSNTRIVAVIFPLFGLPFDEHYPLSAVHEKILKLLKALGIEALDISEIYERIPLEHLQVLPNIDRHPNEIAHRMAAERIYSWLVEIGALPSEFQIKKRFKQRTRIIFEEPCDPLKPDCS
ncbi:MAG: SGNH/GDSL hydrolase family protein [SAR324 cluster bacterium]|uniref:SGNH/GDSL hydrolase family protein n=1 Tax=SAR324 cluster bacterium TaxID=2024889 RepID=A0A7X9IMN6_9DELT|nr:SGNH/GDSL hydrolase family protein [SAR324 cluster bacterium]